MSESHHYTRLFSHHHLSLEQLAPAVANRFLKEKEYIYLGIYLECVFSCTCVRVYTTKLYSDTDRVNLRTQLSVPPQRKVLNTWLSTRAWEDLKNEVEINAWTEYTCARLDSVWERKWGRKEGELGKMSEQVADDKTTCRFTIFNMMPTCPSLFLINHQCLNPICCPKSEACTGLKRDLLDWLEVVNFWYQFHS